MLDQFLTVAYENEKKHAEEVKLARVLRHLPNADLHALATGQAKLAFAECKPAGEDCSWVEKFKDTPLFEQAMQLERSELENEIAREKAEMARPNLETFWQTGNGIRMQKKMLELELQEMKNGSAGGPLPLSVQPVGVEEAQGAGAPGPVPDIGPTTPDPTKVAAARFEKAALDLKALGSAAVSVAKKNPALVGAGIGAVGGAIAGGKDHRLSGALGGAALGAAGGHAASGIGRHMTQTKDLGKAVQAYGGDVAQNIATAKQRFKDGFARGTQVTPSPAPAAAAPAALPPAAQTHNLLPQHAESIRTASVRFAGALKALSG